MELTAIKVSQPLADFYVTKIKASDLLNVSFSEQLQYREGGQLKGSQRKIDERRLREIAKFIDSVEMSFPSSIILAVNYTEEGIVLEDEDEERWRLEAVTGDIYKISIPDNKKIAAIIDGQHRLNAFKYADVSNKDIEVVCSIYFDLPNSYQAFLFATINGNQKKVDKSLALEQFGFNVENEPESSWTPEKLAVYFSRKLNFREDSPLYRKIKLAPQYDASFSVDRHDWIISTAAIVEGILSLISSNPKRDRVLMAEKKIFSGRSRKMVANCNDKTPLRNWYLENRDSDLYNIIVKFFHCVTEVLWSDNRSSSSYIKKTIGILALFDFLKIIVSQVDSDKLQDIDFMSYIYVANTIDFSDNYFSASGIGRARIRKILAYVNNLISEEDLSDYERDNMARILGGTML